MHPSQPAVTITRPHRLGELKAFCHAFFKNLKSDLHTTGTAAFHFISFSSGHVADPLYRASSKWLRLTGNEAWNFWRSFSSFPSMLPGSAPSLCFSPHHGIATDECRDRKLSQDHIFFGLEDEEEGFWSWLV